MKVAYIAERYPRLYHTFIRHEIAGLRQRGVWVCVFAIRRDPRPRRVAPAEEVAQEVCYFEDYLPRIRPRLGRLLWRHEHRLRRLRPAWRRRAAQAAFGVTEAAEALYEIDLGLAHWALGGVAAAIRNGGFDVIHAGFANKAATAAMLLSRATGIPLTFTAHAYDLYVDFKFPHEKVGAARRLFTVSNYNRDFLVGEYRCPAENVEVLRVPFDRSECDRRRGAARAPDLVVSVGRLHPIKGFTYALDAIKRVAERRPVRYVIVGDGPLAAALRARIRRLGLERHVALCGDLDNARALELISRAAVFLLPSVIAADGDRDGVPTSLIEAMYLGTPVVSSDVSGIPELVEHGVSGWLAPPKDVDALAYYVDRLLREPDERAAMGQAAWRRVSGSFYREDSAEILLRCWRACAGERAAPASPDRRRESAGPDRSIPSPRGEATWK